MYVEYYSNRTGEKLGTIMEHKGRLFTDSTNPFLLDELQHFNQPGIPLEKYFGKVSRRFEQGTSYKVFDDNDQQIVITEEGKVIVLNDPAKGETSAPEHLPDVSSVDDVVYARIAFYDLNNRRLGAIEYRDGDLNGLDAFGVDHLENRLEGTAPELLEHRKKYILMVDLVERASYLTNIVEELVRRGDSSNA